MIIDTQMSKKEFDKIIKILKEYQNNTITMENHNLTIKALDNNHVSYIQIDTTIDYPISDKIEISDVYFNSIYTTFKKDKSEIVHMTIDTDKKTLEIDTTSNPISYNQDITLENKVKDINETIIGYTETSIFKINDIKSFKKQIALIKDATDYTYMVDELDTHKVKCYYDSIDKSDFYPMSMNFSMYLNDVDVIKNNNITVKISTSYLYENLIKNISNDIVQIDKFTVGFVDMGYKNIFAPITVEMTNKKETIKIKYVQAPLIDDD